MITVTRKIEFDAAHRVMEHQGKCIMLHGHTYVMEVSFTSPKLDELGMVVDFKVIKNRLLGWINENWDHNTILNRLDKDLGDSVEKITGQKVYYLEHNPTAEVMAEYVFQQVIPSLFPEPHLKCTRIALYESSCCYAEISN